MSLVAVKFVRVKMLPFDNKSEFQVIIDMPAGSTLENTAALTREIGDSLRTVPEVTDYEMYIGTAAPYNFNGLVRHYFLAARLRTRPTSRSTWCPRAKERRRATTSPSGCAP